jgi:histidinol-phosphate/aromatic aminotransferase/cobyric acid decarboxylase-like protein
MLNMMNSISEKRSAWTFEYTAARIAEGAAKQKAFRESRVEAWSKKKEALMQEVRDSGLEVSESAGAEFSNYTSAVRGPQLMVRSDLQAKLTECHGKIQQHQQAVAEYDGWYQVLLANPEARLQLTQQDWLYFFGKV